MQKNCRITGQQFEITAEDLDFYAKVSPVFAGKTYNIPPPSLCPIARQQRHQSFRNERTLYRRKCDKTGKSVVSIFSPSAPFPVYDTPIWFAEEEDGSLHGREFDFSRPFFEQFAELAKVVPRSALLHRTGNENSPYTNLVSHNKNCHYIFAASNNEDCFFSTYIQRCRDVSDSFFIFDSELCYECIDCHHCYRLRFSQDCSNCSESDHLLGCTNCRNCFGCISLANKQYCLFNQQLNKTSYTQALEKIRAQPNYLNWVEQQLQALRSQSPRKYYSGINNFNCSGDHLANCKNVTGCYDCTDLEDSKHCTWLHRAKDCYDCYAWGYPGELGLENHLVGNNFYRVVFSEDCSDNISNLIYCQSCYLSCNNLFGCIGLRRKEYCILNKQYRKAEYEVLVPKIIEHMINTVEWGEFFPHQLSPFGYNETLAQEYYPLTQEQCLQRGWNWRDQDLPGTYGQETADLSELRIDISQATDEICDKTFACEGSGKNYRITKPELALYRKLFVSLPHKCFDTRYSERFAKRNPRRLFARACKNCQTELSSTFNPERAEPIYCESCFLEATF